jgi:hypothetical protein
MQNFDDLKPPSKSPPEQTFALGRQLLERNMGDVVFVVRDSDQSLKKLYAWSSILSEKSEYFAASSFPFIKFTVVGLSPEWQSTSARSRNPRPTSPETLGNGDFVNITAGHSKDQEMGSTLTLSDHIVDTEMTTSNEEDSRKTIYLDDPEDDIDFDTLHNILYFLYTGCVNLHVGGFGRGKTVPEGYPVEPDPFKLYRHAEKLLLTSLSERCLLYLKTSMSPLNISERLFCGEVEHYDGLREMYLQYLLANYNEVKATKGWSDIITNAADATPSTRHYQEQILLEITKRLSVSQILSP